MHESIRVVNYAKKKKITFLIFFHVIVNRNTDTFFAYQRSERVKINCIRIIIHVCIYYQRFRQYHWFVDNLSFVLSLPEISVKNTVHLKLHFTFSYRGSIISYDTYKYFFSRFLNLRGLTSWQNDRLCANNLEFN